MVFSECFMAFLALFDICAENRIFEQEPCFYKFRKMTLTCLINMPSIVGRALLIDKLVMNPGLSYVRITTSYINIGQKITWSQHITWPIQNVGVHPTSGGWRPLYAGRWADTSNFVIHILFFKWKWIPRSGHNISHYKTAKLMIHVQR